MDESIRWESADTCRRTICTLAAAAGAAALGPTRGLPTAGGAGASGAGLPHGSSWATWIDAGGVARRAARRVSAPGESLHGAGELRRVIEELHPRSFGWALACCDGDADEAADVLQVSYLKILDGNARFAGRSQLSTFLYGVIRRTCAERRRRRLRRRLLLERHFTAAPSPIEVGEPELPAAGQRLREALASLPTRQREVLHLVFYGELTIGEAADVMRVRIGTARIHYARGKQRLRQLLSEEGESR